MGGSVLDLVVSDDDSFTDLHDPEPCRGVEITSNVPSLTDSCHKMEKITTEYGHASQLY